MMKMNLFGILTIAFAMSEYIKCDNVAAPGPSLFCSDLNPQNTIDIEQVRHIQCFLNFFSN